MYIPLCLSPTGWKLRYIYNIYGPHFFFSMANSRQIKTAK